MGVMTVRETFEFVAKLTMEPGTSKEDERKRIEHVIGVSVRFSIIWVSIMHAGWDDIFQF